MKHETRAADTAEVFTPRTLVRDMLSRLPNQVWFDPNKTWLEPAAGDGNFLVEIKARLLQAGHPERHVLNHQLFSIELMDDNHYVLQLRLGYIQEVEEDGKTWLMPGPELMDDLDFFTVNEIDPLTQDLNHLSPYAGKWVYYKGRELQLTYKQVYHHVNHRCASALDGIDFPGAETVTDLPILPERDLGEWPDTDTPEIGEKTIVSIYRGQGTWFERKKVEPVLKSLAKDGKNPTKPVPVPKPKVEKPPKVAVPKQPKAPRPPKSSEKQGGWQVKAEWYGKGMKIRCARPYDGSFWECDHDALADAINAALRAKGKPILGEPGPSQKVYGAGEGLREFHLWSRV